jgi:ATP-dependent Clp protease ATP-binding subunit ClpA
MAHVNIQLTTVTSVLADDVELAEALGFPEISALGDTERRTQASMQAKAKAVLEDGGLSPVVSLHRRRIIVAPELIEVEITLEPPRRSPEWQEPVVLRVPVVCWVEDGDLHQAYIPALGILVMAPRNPLLEERIKGHIRLILTGRRKKLGLRDLAQVARIESLKLQKIELSAKIASPKEIAISQGAEQEKTSMLETLAEELPPHLPRAAVVNGASTKPTLGKAPPLSPNAFEMEAELTKLAEALAGAHRRSILLVGPAGSGKTALVRELARRRSEFGFGQTQFWSTSGARLMTGPIGFGMWQERCQKLCVEVAKSNSILHLGNLGELLEVGKARRGQQSVGGFLRPHIARGDILTIAECTPEQVSVVERNDSHLLAAFLQLPIPERTAEQTRVILGRVFENAAGKLAPEKIADIMAALDRMHQLHLRYAIYSANPGRPIRFLRNLLSDHSLEKALNAAEVTTAFSRETGLPEVLLDDHIQLDLEKTRNWFSVRLIGQPEAITRVVDLLTIIKARLARPKKPLASFLFIGPTGTGKTELAKALAEFLFGDASRLARFDLNQFNSPLALQRLIGGPLSGSKEGLLTARVREQPFSVLLLDEFEKVDPGFFDLLLQILGDGRLTDASGRVADFCNCVIVMTSNLGAEGFQRGPAGFRADGTTTPDAREHFTEAVRKFLRPEIFNRLDAVVPFRPLPAEVVLGIAKRQVELLRQRDGFRLRPVKLEILPEVAEHLARKGHDVRYGARPLKRAIERELLAPLAEAMTRYSEDQPITAQVGVAQNTIQVDVKSVPVNGQSEVVNLAHPVQSSEGQLPEKITLQRRLIARLKNCSAASELENQVTMTESLARRLEKAKWKSPEQQKRLVRLPKLQECLAAIAVLYDRARQAETEALSAFYQGENLESTLFAAELEAMDRERQRLLREVFRLRLDEPDDIVLAVYSEDRATLLELAGAYHRTAGYGGQVIAFDYFLPPAGGRSTASKPTREPAKKLGHPFDSAPENAIGLVMHLRGDLFFARYQSEAGQHEFKARNAEPVCLVETRRLPFDGKDGYEPPEGIERKGGIKSKGASLCRRYDREKEQVTDASCGERPWREFPLDLCLRALIEERLHKTIEAITS